MSATAVYSPSGSNGELQFVNNTGIFDASTVFFDPSTSKLGINTQGTGAITHTLTVTGTILSTSGFSGSLTRLKDGKSYLVAGSNVTITSASNGQVTIASTGGGGSLTVQSGTDTVSNVSTLDFSNAASVTDAGSGQVNLVGTIGQPEDGTYTDGLFTNFLPTTPVGTAVDRINEVLKALSPTPAPDLDDINSNETGVTALLSFGASSAVSGYTNVSNSAGVESAVDVNGTYQVLTASNNIRAAVFNGSTAVTGVLNADVEPSNYSNGITNYTTSSFGDADQGVLRLDVNGSTLKQIDLTAGSIGAGIPGAGSGSYVNGNGSGFIYLSQTGSAVFDSGKTLVFFQHRTGRYVVSTSDQRNGWNYARVLQVLSSSTKTTNYIEWVNDSNSNALTAVSSSLSFEGSGSIELSGVEYNTSGTATYKTMVSNAYKNVYDSNDITFTTTNSGNSSGAAFTIADESKPSINTGAGEDSSKILHITSSGGVTATYMLSGNVATGINVTQPLKTNLSNAGRATAGGILLYTYTNTSTDINETFRREDYRIQSASYDTQASVTDASNVWNSGIFMTSSNGGHSDGLQFFNRSLYAPSNTLYSGDFRNTADGGSLDSGPSGNPNYASVAGTRTFYRRFRNTSGNSVRAIQYTVSGVGTLVAHGGTLGSNNNFKLYFKLPNNGTAATGWMDAASAFSYLTTSNNAGCYVTSLDTSLAATNYAIFGTGTIDSNDYITAKILADAGWTGNISNFSVDFTDVSAVTESPALSQIDSSDTGVDGNLSFGSSLSTAGYTNVGTTAGFSAVDVNGTYSSSGNRLGIFNGLQSITGVLNPQVTASGNNYPADTFGGAHTGTLKLELNGAVVHTVNLHNFTLGTAGNTSTLNSNGTGFVSVSEALPGKDSNEVPDYTKFYRSSSYVITSSEQRDGWNYARVIHEITGVARETTYVEWVNDPYTTAMSFSSIGFDNFGGSALFSLSGVKYFNNTSSTVSGSLKAAISGTHSNIYSDLSNAFSTINLSNLSISSINFAGTGYVADSHSSDSTVELPLINTSVANAQSYSLLVTASYACTLTDSLPDDADSASAKFRVYHPLKSTLTSNAQSKSTFLIFSSSDSSTRSTTENFTGEIFRVLSASTAYNTRSNVTASAYVWDSTANMNSAAGHDDGLLVYDGKLYSPLAKGNSGDFRNIADSGLYQGPDNNANYSSLTKSVRSYYRAFKNNTSSDVAQVTIELTGSATLVGRSGANSGSIGADTNVYFDVKIPGKTAWLDLAKPGGGTGVYTTDGDGCLKGTLDPTVDSNGAENLCSFQGETSDGTSGLDGTDYVMIRINAHKDWTGNFDEITIRWE